MGLTKKGSKTPSFRLWIWQICNSQPESESSREREREREKSLERERERNELDINSRVRSSESSTEGEGSDPLQACPQGHSQLGRSSPSLLPRCTPLRSISLIKKSSIFHLFISILIIELLSLFFFFFNLWILKILSLSLSLSGFGAPRTFRSPQTRGSFSLFLASIFYIWINFYFFSIRNSIFLAHNVVL